MDSQASKQVDWCLKTARVEVEECKMQKKSYVKKMWQK